MTKSKGTSFVDRVREDTSRYLQELLTENERLRSAVSDMQAEQRRAIESKEALQRALDFESGERAAMTERIQAMERENESYLAQYVTVQEQISDLANLYIAAYRVTGTNDREKLIAAIEEVVVNFVGSEELAIFELTTDGKTLELASSFGIEELEFARVPVGNGIIGRVAQSGEAYIVLGNGGGERETAAGLPVNAVVPLTVDGKITGVIVVFRLLQQKASLLDSDAELLNLLGTHSAPGLLRSR
ncbi:MAG: GAF domain-containing protein [Clostridia bacterium]|nr:GAF domain-containing protein [Deltaproteobacteria bacterium]